MRVIHFLLIGFLLFVSGTILAQDFEPINPESKPVHARDIQLLSPLEILEDSLVYFADSMYNTAVPESRIDAGYAFIRSFKQFLKTPNSFQYPCTKLKEQISILPTQDGRLKLYSWEVVRGPLEKRYYGVIQLQDGSFIPLVDVSDQILRGAEDSVFKGTRWYGAIYYQIQEEQIGDMRLYFLFGWNGNSVNSEKISGCIWF
ncbi:MAG: hypothetical protein HWD58_02925 [Bacteroidota bacterium]|nr:MAG: hypothetical protein HWD58_02925 [Bacteroidota bacterium]